jgi:D-glycero-alpha-D-manno-heptose 1-phosphate guanylyltransferase
MDMLVLAGGFGTRLKDVVSDVPKPMAPINGVPMLQLQLGHWILQGQRSFIFLLYHQAETIIKLLIDQSRFYGSSVNIDWIVENTPLGTGGSVSNAIHKRGLTGSILIANADTWLDGGLQKISNSKSAAIGVIKVENTARYGSVFQDSDGYITEFVEKKKNSKFNGSGIINAGIYKLPTRTFSRAVERAFSLETEILPQLSRNKLLREVMFKGNFFDIGVPKDYYKFCDWYRLKKENHE